MKPFVLLMTPFLLLVSQSLFAHDYIDISHGKKHICSLIDHDDVDEPVCTDTVVGRDERLSGPCSSNSAGEPGWSCYEKYVRECRDSSGNTSTSTKERFVGCVHLNDESCR